MIVLFLSSLKARNIALEKKGDGLVIRGDQHQITAELKAQLKQLKRQILAFFERHSLTSSTQIVLTSFNQKRLWLIHEMQGKSPEYVLMNKVQINEAVTDACMQSIYEQLLARYDVFRTGFIKEDLEVFQLIRPYCNHTLQTIDLSYLNEEQQRCEVKHLMNQQREMGFDLYEGPLLRMILIRMDQARAVLVYSMHHIVSDGWSLSLIRNELIELFEIAQGRLTKSLPTVVQFSQYSDWERRTFIGEKSKQLTEYWYEKLVGIPNVHNLPLDFVRPQQGSVSGAVYFQTIDNSVVEPFKQLTSKYGTTLFAGMYGVFSLLLYRLSQVSDIVIGTPVLNRDKPELRNIVGYIANTVVLRQQFDNIQTVEQLFHSSRDVVLDAIKYQQMPFDALIQALDLPKVSDYESIYQLFFSVKVDSGAPRSWNKILKSLEQYASCAVMGDMVVEGEVFDEGWIFEWMFCTELFKPETINMFARLFEHLLVEITADPHRQLADIPSLAEQEIAQQVADETSLTHKIQTCSINQLLSQSIATYGQEVAFCLPEQTYSYQWIDNTSRVIACYFDEQGIKPGDIVGLYGDQHRNMCLLILGLLRLGAAYLPLSTELPEARLQYMSNDANVEHMVVIGEYDWQLYHPKLNLHHVNDDTLTQWQQNYAQDYPWYQAEPDDLAVVLYTSGSTGLPKGVKLTQGNLAAYVQGANQAYYMSSKDRVLQFSTATFDIFIEELFMTLVYGGSLVLADRQMLLMPEKFWQCISQRQVSLVSLPTAFWHMLMLTPPAEPLTSLRMVILGGEKLQTNLLQTWQQQMPRHIKLLNTYGPTETTVIATVMDASQFDTTKGDVPIGTSIASSQVYVLQSDGQMAPFGVYGQLAITGPGVANGYLSSAQDQAGFMTNHLDNTSEKLFLTADIACKRPDGTLLFKGRRGNQVKIRGNRIELDEVQYQLNRVDSVAQSVILVEGEGLSVEIVAYVVLTSAAQLQSPAAVFQGIQHHIRGFLPNYMVPAKLMFVSQLPLTVNGKVDVDALDAVRVYTGDSQYEAPANEVEIKLADIWASLLNLTSDQLSAYADFFELGGHSLLLVQLHRDIEETFAISVSFGDLMVQPTIRQMARCILLCQLDEANPQGQPHANIEELRW